MSRWNGFRRNTMLGFHSRKSIVFDCGAPGAPQSRRPGCNAASAAAPKTRREELSRIASVNLKKASSGCRSAVSSRVLAFCVMVVCLVATLGVTAANLRLTYVTDSNGAKQVILTSATDPAKVMSLSGIQSEEGDQVYYTAFSGNLATLNIERAFSVNIQADGQTYPVKMVYGTVADALQRAGITLEGDDYTEPALDRLVTAGTQIVVHRVDYQDRVETQAIPYDTEYVYTSLYFRNTGRTTTVQHGAEGQQTVTTRDRYVDGELENSIVVDSSVSRTSVFIRFFACLPYNGFLAGNIDFSNSFSKSLPNGKSSIQSSNKLSPKILGVNISHYSFPSCNKCRKYGILMNPHRHLDFCMISTVRETEVSIVCERFGSGILFLNPFPYL